MSQRRRVNWSVFSRPKGGPGNPTKGVRVCVPSESALWLISSYENHMRFRNHVSEIKPEPEMVTSLRGALSGSQVRPSVHRVPHPHCFTFLVFFFSISKIWKPSRKPFLSMCCKYFARYLRTFSGGTCLGSFSHCVSCALSSIASTALFLLRFGTALSSCYLWLPFSTVPFYISSALSCCFLSCYLLVLLSFGYLRLVLSPFCSTCSGYKSERAHPAPLSVY